MLNRACVFVSRRQIVVLINLFMSYVLHRAINSCVFTTKVLFSLSRVLQVNTLFCLGLCSVVGRSCLRSKHG